MTQNGTWSGYFQVGTRRIELSDDTWWGCRDRSWGLRRVGEAPPPGAPDGSPHGPGFYWLWAPLNLPDECLIIDVNEYPNGRRWHENASVIPLGLDGTPDEGTYTYDIDWKPGTRHAKGFRADLTLGSGRRETITLVPHLTFFMSGLGYTHPTWGHGMWVGPAAHTYDAIDLATANEAEMIHNHVQILCDVIRSSDGAAGTGVLEMMIIGPHAPSGFTGILDVHP
jgi:hypothetical protein